MEVIYGIVRNIVAYMIFNTVVMNLLGKSSYKKYARLFTGMLFILIIAQPIMQLFQISNVFDYFFESNRFQAEADDMSSVLLEQEADQHAYILKEYKEKIAGQIEEILNNHDLYPIEMNIQVEEDASRNKYGAILQIEIKASYTRADINEYESEGEAFGKVIIDPIKIRSDSEEEKEENGSLNAIDEYEALKQGDKGNNFNNITIIRIKTLLGDFYNMKTSNINIMIQE